VEKKKIGEALGTDKWDGSEVAVAWRARKNDVQEKWGRVSRERWGSSEENHIPIPCKEKKGGIYSHKEKPDAGKRPDHLSRRKRT